MSDNIKAITEALCDLLGPDVVTYHEDNFGPFWLWAEYKIDQYDICLPAERRPIPADTLDKLYAASQVIRRMVTP